MRVITTREVEWDDDNRTGALALHDDEGDRCGQCGLPRSVCSDPETPFYPQHSVCWASAAREMTTRKWDAINKDATPGSDGYLPTDGASIWISPHDLTPDDDFLTPRGVEFNI